MTPPPSIGLFWIYNNEIIFSYKIPLSKGLHYGEAITSPIDHTDYWDNLEKENKLSILPPHLQKEYYSIPRGRIVFHINTKRFTILHGGLKKSQLIKIRKFFNLPIDKTDYDTDFHYTLENLFHSITK